MIKNALQGIARAFDRPEIWFMRSVMIASIVSVVYYAGDKAKDTPTKAIYILLGLAVVGFHVTGAKKACEAWYSRRAVAFMLWCGVIGLCALWEGNSQLTVASQNQGNLSTIQRTAARKTATTEDEVNRIAAQLLKLQNEAAWKTDTLPVATIQAKIDAAKAHRFWAASNECAEPKGKQTREHCDAYRQLLADKGLAERKLVLDEEIKATGKELAEARRARTSGPAVTSEERDDFKTLKKLTGFSPEDLEISQAVLVWMLMFGLLTVAGWLIKAEAYEGMELKPWFNWRGYITRARRLWDGTDHTVIVNRGFTSHQIRDEHGVLRTTLAKVS